MLCLVARYKEEVLRFRVPEAEAKLGSSSENDITLPFPGVSRTHARLAPSHQGILVTDLGSKNGLVVDGKLVKEALLTAGQMIRIGRAALTLEEGSTSDIELAIALDVSPRGLQAHSTRESDSVGSDVSPGSPTAVLRFVRELDRAGRRAAGGDKQQEFLSAARSLLGAESLFLFHVGEARRLTLRAIDGPLPADSVAELVTSGSGPKRRRIRTMKIPDGKTLLVASAGTGAESRGIAAVFPPSAEPIMDWQGELLDYLFEKLLPQEAASRLQREEPMAETAVLEFPPDMILGNSSAIRSLVVQLRATVRSRMDVLLLGETGTGKELFARMIHASGPTPEGRFVAINCAAIPSELLESELFGVHGRVATGVDPHPGLFLQADGGSIFLDEIGELADPLQAKLLRVLQEREVLAVGASTPRKFNVRVISASNRDLLERIREGRFRADLYYRLCGLQFRVPPLRERPEDIPVLVLAFLKKASEEFGKRIQGVSRKAFALLMQHDWPGNIRELENEVRRAVLICPDGGTLRSEHFAAVEWAIDRARAERHTAEPTPEPAAPARQTSHAAETADSQRSLKLRDRLDALEREAILQALDTAKGNQSLAAKLLGISRNGLALKIRKYKLATKSNY